MGRSRSGWSWYGLISTLVVGALLDVACSGGSSSGAEPGACAPLPLACEGSAPSYSGTIQPLLDLRCAGCHVPGSVDGPWPFETYADVADWSPAIRNELEMCFEQPPHSRDLISEAERITFNAWATCGAPEN